MYLIIKHLSLVINTVLVNMLMWQVLFHPSEDMSFNASVIMTGWWFVTTAHFVMYFFVDDSDDDDHYDGKRRSVARKLVEAIRNRAWPSVQGT